LEDSPLFNAGKGSVFTSAGTHEMDAAIMEGKQREAGAVAMISGIKNPILLANDVMKHSGHVLLAGEGALSFAKLRNYEFLPPSYFHDAFRYEQWLQIKDTDLTQLDHTKRDHKFGTVGAVACDMEGNIAAATSTGGMTNKKFGRIGDSPLIGSGTYANNQTCAVSCTGSGEFFIRGAVAYDVSCLIEHKNYTLQQACDEVIKNRLMALGGDGGLIAINAQAEIAMSFNTEGMYRGFKHSDGSARAIIYED
jgi:beta-aspartyl-peptidase (threonine type)